MPYLKKYPKKNYQKSSRHTSSSIGNRQSSIVRGKLAPLMTEEAKSTATIQDLSYDFACRIVRLYQYLTDPNDVIFDSSFEEGNAPHKTHHTPHEREFIMSKQVVRSGTSIGANVSEAENGQSKADFYAKMSIAAKEANETNYWLRLLHDNGYINDFQFTSLDADMQRVLNKLKAIVKSTRASLDEQKQSKDSK